MFSVCQCDRLGPLAEQLFAEMDRDPLPPLEPEVVVVAQNRGLRGWLTNALARHSGCAASLAMPSPRDLCLRLARRASAGEALPRDPFDPEPLAWRIAAFLDALPAEARYAPLRAYLEEGPGRRLPLARRIAGRFSDYQVYRPRLLAQWAAGQNPQAGQSPAGQASHAAWQAPLWRHLTARSAPPDRARRLLALQGALEGADPGAPWLPTRVSVFGAGLFPPLYLDVLAALATHVPVRFYLVDTPGEDDTVLGRRLGRQRRVLREQLRARADAWDPLDARRPATAPVTALGAVQAHTTTAPPPQADDRSLHVHSCHSPRRELEVLRDQLLDAFETMPELAPEDVLVLVPGLEQYAPLIETTFEAEEAGRVLPVHLASGRHGEERRVLQAMEALLALPESRHTAAEVMELLDYPVLRRAAGLGPEEVPLARRWVREAGVRWGRASEHRAAFDLPEDGAGTWRTGLDRLLLGYVMGPVDALVEGRLPYAEATAARADVLGRLAAWLHRLFSFAEDAQTPRPLAAWGGRMAEAAAALLAPATPAEHDAVQHLIEASQGLEHLDALVPAEAVGAAHEAPFAAVREHFQEAIAAYDAGAEHVTGRITFAEPMALRFAPHRVVAFVGLGNGFPPTPARPADDLIAAAPRPTDHDPQREGEQLFYDALHAAEDRLILTYVGRSEKSNDERAPSAVLEALLETCENTFGAAGGSEEQGGSEEGSESGEAGIRSRFVTEHPLQPFHPAYFTPGGALFSYDRAHGAARGARQSAAPFVTGRLPEEDEAGATVRLGDLQRAWVHPARFFCTRVLGLRLEGEEPLDTQEPLSPDGLAAYQVRQKTLRMALKEVPPKTWAERLEAEGALPPGRLGAAWYGPQRDEAHDLARRVQAHGPHRPRTLRASSESGDGWSVTGRLDHVTGGHALAFRCAAPRAKDLARAWPAHLLLCAAAGSNGSSSSDGARPTLVLGSGDAGWRLRPLAPAAAREQLHRLVRGYRSIRCAPPPFFPEAAMAFVEAGSRYRAERAARKAFYHDRWNPGEENDPYVQLCFRARDPLRDDFDLFEQWARAFWKPLLAHREEA